MSKTLSVVIPAYNEAKTIHLILDRVFEAETGGIRIEAVVVNDCSTDDTGAMVRDYMSARSAIWERVLPYAGVSRR